jgi:hypothetical protein
MNLYCVTVQSVLMHIMPDYRNRKSRKQYCPFNSHPPGGDQRGSSGCVTITRYNVFMFMLILFCGARTRRYVHICFYFQGNKFMIYFYRCVSCGLSILNSSNAEWHCTVYDVTVLITMDLF